MNLAKVVLEYDLASFIGFMLESISYGIYCVIFVAYVKIRQKRKKGGSKILLYLVTANFIACTAYLALDVTASQKGAAFGPVLASNTIYSFIDSISQVILIYRCWVLWGRPWVVVAPILLTLAFLAITLSNLATFHDAFATQSEEITSESLAVAHLYHSTVLSFFSISLTENALVTGLIIFKIVTVYRNVQGLESRAESGLGRDIVPIISILIESGVITFAAQLVQILVFKLDNTAYPIIGGLVVMLYGISTAIVLVRVEMGLSSDVGHKTSTIHFQVAATQSQCSTDNIMIP